MTNNKMRFNSKTLIKLPAMALTTVMALTLGACQQNKFTVEGTVDGAQDSVLYLQSLALSGAEVIDSVRLEAGGAFCLHGDAPEAPEFYVLRIADQIINISIDSTETVTVRAKYPNMAANYEVEGSENCQTIRTLALKQQDLQRRAIALEQAPLPRQTVKDSLQRMVDAYKQDVTNNYIFKNPAKASSYFALFQTLGPWLIFDPKNNAADIKVFAAVATSWDTYYPGAQRGQNLHNITIEGMKNMKRLQAMGSGQIDESIVVESGVLELQLPDSHGQLRTLTELKGQVVLLDFHSFQIDKSPQRILMLRDLYNKYHEQGLQIYQVSLDADEHFWRQMTMQLPWISVRDESGQSAVKYNVQAVPEFFLIDRQNQLQKRSTQISDLEQEIRKLLNPTR